jgi:putative hemolysin
MLDTQERFRELIVHPPYAPETKPVDELLEELRAEGKRFAFCVDEYGGIAGLVTLEDILEEVFGEFYDEYTKADPLIKCIDEGKFLVQCKIGLHELNEALEIALESQTSETLNGWMLEHMGRIPKLNDFYHYQNLTFFVREVFRRRIVKVELQKKL